jgi:hypothetical protein
MSSPVISGSVQGWKKRKKYRGVIKRNNVLLTRVFSKYASWLLKRIRYCMESWGSSLQRRNKAVYRLNKESISMLKQLVKSTVSIYQALLKNNPETKNSLTQ